MKRKYLLLADRAAAGFIITAIVYNDSHLIVATYESLKAIRERYQSILGKHLRGMMVSVKPQCLKRNVRGLRLVAS